MSNLIEQLSPNLVLPNKPWFHFSIDDILPSLIDVSLNNMSLFDHKLMKFMKYVYEKKGLTFDLMLFYEQTDYDGTVNNLGDIRDIRSELIEAGDFIRFGPHSLNSATPPHNQTTQDQITTFDSIFNQIDRFAGDNMRSRWVRLHFFSELFELGSYFKKNGIEALFLTDNPVVTHRMNETCASRIKEHGCVRYNDTNFIRTHFRLEDFPRARLSKTDITNKFRQCLDKHGFIVMMSHEYELTRTEVRVTLMEVLKILDELEVELYNPAFIKEV